MPTTLTTVVTYRPVATFPLNGREDHGYIIFRTEDQDGNHVHGLPHYTVMYEGRVLSGAATFETAIAECLRRAGWGSYDITEVTS
jgi:hypothetical protein